MLILISPNADPTDVVPLETLKTHLRVEHDDDDDYLTLLISAAIEYCERQCGRSLGLSTWEYATKHFPRGRGVIEIPRPPLNSIVSIKYEDSAGVEQTIAADDYRVLKPYNLSGVVVPKVDWPTSSEGWYVTIRFTAGATANPATIVACVCLLVGHWYEHREAVSELNLKEVPITVNHLLAQLNVGGL